jgi:hypothetical protein
MNVSPIASHSLDLRGTPTAPMMGPNVTAFRRFEDAAIEIDFESLPSKMTQTSRYACGNPSGAGCVGGRTFVKSSQNPYCRHTGPLKAGKYE